MEAPNLSPLLLIFFLFFLLQISFTIATKKSYIVYLGAHSYDSETPSEFDFQQVTNSHYDILESSLGSKETAKEAIFYSYTRNINGFAAVIDEKIAEDLAKNPNVISVIENKGRELHTTRSWSFLGLENEKGIPSRSIWNAAKFGQDTIIANLDTGVWPESESFSDSGYGPIPSKWKGICQTESNFHCNKKLIGARYFYKGYIAEGGTLNSSEITARDNEGHGTHTLSTAGGNFVSGANVFGKGNGTSKGGSPKARVATYKVCWPMLLSGSCYDADIIAAIDYAISDGVDVISISLGSSSLDYVDDAMGIASFHAVQKGILVVCSGGNSGPDFGSVTNSAPWQFTVGASTIDRVFQSNVAFGTKKRLKGESLSNTALPKNKFYPLITSLDAAINASNQNAKICSAQTLDPKKVKGKIVVCTRSEGAEVNEGHVAARAGAVGMIVANDLQSGDRIFPNMYLLPATAITYNDSQILFQYIKSTKSPVAHITGVKTKLGVRPSPVMAWFSSRGPNIVEASILKPDITAPGVNILASYSSGAAPTTSDYDTRRIPFNVISGTSMSCPHISGIAGLLKTLYPKWSPAAIKSAIMTTAKTRSNDLRSMTELTKLEATPFAYGSGHVNPNRAMDPGLVYDITSDDYLNFLCARGYNATQLKKFTNRPFTCLKSFTLADFNYPSISVPNLKLGVIVTINRKVKNVGNPGTYVALVKAPASVSISVEPNTLQFSNVDEEKTFKVVVKRNGKGTHEDYVFGTLVWSDGKHFVRSPIAINLVK